MEVSLTNTMRRSLRAFPIVAMDEILWIGMDWNGIGIMSEGVWGNSIIDGHVQIQCCTICTHGMSE